MSGSNNSGSNTSKMAVPQAKEAMNRFKQEVASEIGVPLKEGYNGDLTSAQAGSIGGGKVEFEAGKYAVNIRNTETKVYELGQGAGDLGMICGGTVRVLFEPVNM